MFKITFKVLCADNDKSCNNVMKTMEDEGFVMKNSDGYHYDHFGTQQFETIMKAESIATQIRKKREADLIVLDLHME